MIEDRIIQYMKLCANPAAKGIVECATRDYRGSIEHQRSQPAKNCMLGNVLRSVLSQSSISNSRKQ